MYFKYKEEIFIFVYKENLYKFGYLTQNFANLIWNTDKIQHKVNWAVNYFSQKISNSILQKEDIYNECYITFVNCLLKFDIKLGKLFLSYFNRALQLKLKRMAEKTIRDNTIEKQFNYICVNKANFIEFNLLKTKLNSKQINCIEKFLNENIPLPNYLKLKLRKLYA